MAVEKKEIEIIESGKPDIFLKQIFNLKQENDKTN